MAEAASSDCGARLAVALVWSPSPEPDAWRGDAVLESGLLEQLPPDAPVVVPGGLGPSEGLAERAREVAARLGRRIVFVVSPDDCVGGSLGVLRAELAAASAADPRVEWLGLGHALPLGAGRLLIGHGGWGDTRAAPVGTPCADHPRHEQGGVAELVDVPSDLLRQRLLLLGSDARDRLRVPLDQACARAEEVVVVAGTPPVRLSEMTDEQAVHGVCGALGLLLGEARWKWPDTRLTVVCAGRGTPARPGALGAHATVDVVPPGTVRLLRVGAAEAVSVDSPVVRPREEAGTVRIAAVLPPDDPTHDPATDDRAAALQWLSELAEQPVESVYPLTHNETPEGFQAAFASAVASLSESACLDSVDYGGVSLARWLLHLTVGPLHPGLGQGVGRVRLVGDLVRNIVMPGRINQGRKGTCAATCVEVWLAERHPAEYARVVAGLARPEGRVLLYNAEPIDRDEDVFVYSEEEGDRAPVSRLFQVAAMDYADPDTDYRNVDDQHFELDASGVAVPTGTGLAISDFDRLLEGMTGEVWRDLTDQDTRLVAALEAFGASTEGRLRLDRDAVGIIERSLAAGDAAFVTLAPSTPPDLPETRRAGQAVAALPHKVRVLEVDRVRGRVVYEDPFDPEEPWIPEASTEVLDAFGRCAMRWDDFFSLIVELSFRPEHAP